ncbi:acetyl-CoA carboxylase carboxyltransferase subunit alpha [bacterium]|nr:acetyl-CoA carboxylase carboxyltransferase subunit alpha [bacterium]
MPDILLDFEKPIVKLEKKISEMKALAEEENLELAGTIRNLEKKLDKLVKDTYSGLSRWERVQLARHPARPFSLDYINHLFTDFTELHGDRLFGDDPALVGGPAFFNGRPVMVIGQQKGRNTKEKLFRNFGMMNPEGYRKAIRLMKMAAKFRRPIIVFVDTPGAYPGLGAEERGQGEAIARNIYEMARLPVPLVVVIIGEGASGGALGIGLGDRILMLENSWYSVITPEGCAAILWRDAAKANLAADALKLIPADLIKLGVIDEIISEPGGGAHRNFAGTADAVRTGLLTHLAELDTLDGESLISARLEKYAAMGYYHDR